MKLDEFHVLQFRPCTKGHGHPIARGIGRIRCPGKNLAGAPSRQYDRFCGNNELLTGVFVEDYRPTTAPSLDDEIHRKVVIQAGDPLLSNRLRHERSNHLISRRVTSRAKNTATAMRGFPRKCEFPPGLVELRSPVDELLNAIRPFLHKNTYCLSAAQPMARLHRIRQMDGDIVLFAQRDRNTALCEDRIALERMPFGEHDHSPDPAEFQRGTKPGHSAPDDEEICFRH